MGIERRVYAAYRRAKVGFLSRPPSLSSKAFFLALGIANDLMSPRRHRRQEDETDVLWRARYLKRYGGRPLYQVKTDVPIASYSDDHKKPRGAAYDNSSNQNFNNRLYQFVNHRPVLLLDLGCSGGGLVRSIINDGNEAVGIEGSDFSKRTGAGEWKSIPMHLFTADITKPFAVVDRSGQPVQFDCVTAWEVLEHIPASLLPALFDNIRRHLGPDGIFVGSIDTQPDADHYTGAVYHLSVHERRWWKAQWTEAGFVEVEQHPFKTQDMVRGHGQSLRDWDPADGTGFHVVLRLA